MTAPEHPVTLGRHPYESPSDPSGRVAARAPAGRETGVTWGAAWAVFNE